MLLPTPAAAPPSGVVLLSVPGLDARVLGQYRDGAPVMPTLLALAQAGVLAEHVEAVAPASVYPAHATLLTGALPAEHGVVADRRLGEHGVRNAFYAHASYLQRATLWQRVAEVGRPVASLDWPSTRGAAIARLLPDADSAGDGTWLAQLADAATPALRDFVAEHGGRDPAASSPGPARDATLLALACDLLVGEAPPQLLLARLGGPAPALARSGPGSREAAQAYEVVDRGIRGLLDCLAAAGRLEPLALAVVGDHGSAAVHTAITPNAVLADAGLVVRSEDGISSWRAIARSNGGSAFVYARDERAAVAARLALSTTADRTRAFRVVSAEEMIVDGADPEAWFGLEAEPGYGFRDESQGELLTASTQRGIGGYLPERSEMQLALVIWGRGVRQGLVVPRMAQVDVGPTLARLLGVKLEATVGRALVGLLSATPPAAPAAPGAPE